MCLRHLLHLLKSREKVWQALGSMPLFQAGSCTSNNWLHAAAWEFSHRAWQAATSERGARPKAKAVTGKSPSRRRVGQFLCTQVLLYGISGEPSNRLTLKFERKGGGDLKPRVMRTMPVPLLETSRQKGKNSWSHTVPEIRNKSGVKDF